MHYQQLSLLKHVFPISGYPPIILCFYLAVFGLPLLILQCTQQVQLHKHTVQS